MKGKTLGRRHPRNMARTWRIIVLWEREGKEETLVGLNMAVDRDPGDSGGQIKFTEEKKDGEGILSETNVGTISVRSVKKKSSCHPRAKERKGGWMSRKGKKKKKVSKSSRGYGGKVGDGETLKQRGGNKWVKYNLKIRRKCKGMLA